MENLEAVYVVEAEGYKPSVYVTYANAKKRLEWLKRDQELRGVLVPNAFCTRVKIEY